MMGTLQDCRNTLIINKAVHMDVVEDHYQRDVLDTDVIYF